MVGLTKTMIKAKVWNCDHCLILKYLTFPFGVLFRCPILLRYPLVLFLRGLEKSVGDILLRHMTFNIHPWFQLLLPSLSLSRNEIKIIFRFLSRLSKCILVSRSGGTIRDLRVVEVRWGFLGIGWSPSAYVNGGTTRNEHHCLPYSRLYRGFHDRGLRSFSRIFFVLWIPWSTHKSGLWHLGKHRTRVNNT